MASALLQKKFKLELEFTVTMDEVDCETPESSFAHRLQQELLKDEVALTRLMISAAMNKLQGYADYLAAQDEIAPLLKAALALDPGDLDQAPPTSADFVSETRTLRTSCLPVRLDHSQILEETHQVEGETAKWQLIWSDLRPESELGRLFEQLSIPTTPVRPTFRQDAAHYLQVRYITRQRDSIHIEGRCTCQETFEGAGCDESQALDDLLAHYQAHRTANRPAQGIQLGAQVRMQPGKQ